jgi:glutamate formiminotransferase / 5-formyltetrahydrofolate cyclo-ligase
VLECVVNVSEGRDASAIAAIAAAAATDLLDVHTDPHHHRSVLTLVGEDAPRRVATEALARLDLSAHDGVHPRLGVVDVVPFVPLDGSTSEDAEQARDRFAGWLARAHGVPAFLFGTGRSLPDIRREAFRSLRPDTGPATPHPTAGAVCVGFRGELVAYNVWLTGATLAQARAIAAEIRRPQLRALGLSVGDSTQVSMNLVAPRSLGPDAAYDLVAARVPAPATIERAELVGLMPAQVLEAIEPVRWLELDLSPERTIDARLAARDSTGRR